jgi:hypothetical protein
METTTKIVLITVLCSIIIALNAMFGLKDRFKNFLRSKLEIPTEREKLNQERMKSDIDLYKKIKSYLDSDGNMMEIRDIHFGSSFRDNLTEDLHKFIWECKKPEFEFHNDELESAKKELVYNLVSLLDSIGQYTFTNDTNTDFRSVPKDWSYKLPDKYEKVIKTLNSRADSTIDAYDLFIRKCRKELAL